LSRARLPSIINGKVKAVVIVAGKLMIYNIIIDKLLLQEYSQSQNDLLDLKCSSLAIEARKFSAIPNRDYKLTL